MWTQHRRSPLPLTSATGSDTAEYQGQLLPYLTGEKKAPLPTYFIGGWGLGAQQALEALPAARDSNIHYLGRAGVREVAGLNVAFLDGTYSAAAYHSADPEDEGGPGVRYYRKGDVALLNHALNHAVGDMDILLTNEWPAGIADGLPDGAKPAGVKTDGEGG
jgi:lariat debranching enzyme